MDSTETTIDEMVFEEVLAIRRYLGGGVPSNSILVMYFLFFGLLFGSMTLWLKNRFSVIKLSYTSLLMLVGVGLGALHMYTDKHIPVLSDSLELWIQIDPFLLMALFLPALLFSDVMKINIHLFQRSFWQVFILAVPGVLINTTLMGLLCRVILSSYGFSWTLCFLLGTVLGATDPVAVVATLEEAEAPPKLTMVMNGESHLSDLVVLVLFQILLKYALGIDEVSSASKLIAFLVRMLIGGPALGVVMGMIALFWIRQTIAPTRRTDVIIQFTTTLVLAYLAFIVSEYNFSGNGVLASVSAGLVIAAWGHQSFANRETMENIWLTIEYVGNTLVFLLAGVILGTTVYEKHQQEVIEGRDYLMVLAFWGLLMLCRLLIVAVFFPLLRGSSYYGLKKREAAVIVWGGVRGAVTITLAIVVLNSAEDPAEFLALQGSLEAAAGGDVQQALSRFFFIVGGVAMLTQLINSTTTEWLLHVLHITTRSSVKKQLLQTVEERVMKNSLAEFQKLVQEDEFKDVTLEEIQECVQSLEEHSPPSAEQISAEKPNFLGDMLNVSHEDADKHVLLEVRELFLNSVKAHYWEEITNGKIPSNSKAAHILLSSTDAALDEIDEGLNDLEHLNLPKSLEEDENQLHERVFAFIDRCLPQWVTIDNYFGEKMHNRMREQHVYVATTYIQAHKHAQKKVATFVGEDETIDTPEEALVIQESQQNVRLAEAFIQLAVDRDPAIVDLVRRMKVATTILHSESLFVHKLFEQGLVDGKWYKEKLTQLRANESYLSQVRGFNIAKVSKENRARSQGKAKSVSLAVSKEDLPDDAV